MSLIWADTNEHCAAWDALLQAHPAGSPYLLSWYLRHQRVPRCESAIAFIERDGRAAAGAVLYHFRLPAGNAIHLVPGGPIAAAGHEKCLPELIAAIAERARAQGSLLLQFEAFEPQMRDPLRDAFAGLRLRDEPVWKLYHPTLWRELRVDLADKNPDTLLAGYSTSTRQRVKEAVKKNVEVQELRDDAGIDAAHRLWIEGGERKSYTIRPLESFRAVIRDMYERNAGTLLMSRVDGAPAAFVHALFHGVGSTYMSGAHKPAISGGFGNRILQYRAMCMAVERGARWYSLGGPATGGVREFKQGFRPVLVDNMRFVSVELKRMRLWALRGVIGQARWIQQAKRWAMRGRS